MGVAPGYPPTPSLALWASSESGGLSVLWSSWLSKHCSKGKPQASRRFLLVEAQVFFRLKGFYLSTPCQYQNAAGIDTGIPGFSCPGRFCQYRQYLEGKKFSFLRMYACSSVQNVSKEVGIDGIAGIDNPGFFWPCSCQHPNTGTDTVLTVTPSDKPGGVLRHYAPAAF